MQFKHTSPVAWEAAGGVRPAPATIHTSAGVAGHEGGQLPEKAAFEVNDGEVLAIDPDAIGALYGRFDSEEVQVVGGSGVLTIHGPLDHHAGYWFDSYDAIRQRFDKAIDSDAERLILKIDSPGGYVSGCFELARYMRQRADESGKRLIAYVDGMACSAAYAIACACDEIIVPSTGRVGSIGVIRVVADMTAMAEKAGVQFHVITSGKRKADGHPFKHTDEEAIKSMQAEVDELAGVFFSWVAERRGIDIEKIQKLEARCLIGDSAVKFGLANSVGSFDDLTASLTAGASHGDGATAMKVEIKIGGLEDVQALVDTIDKALDKGDEPAVETSIQPPSNGGKPGDAAASPQTRRSIMDRAIFEVFGLKEDAPETALLAAATKMRDEKAEAEGERGELFSAMGVDNIEAAKGAIEAAKANKKALDEANAELQAVKDAKLASEREALLAQAKEMYPPATMEKLSEASIDFVRAYIDMTPASAAAPSENDKLPTEPPVDEITLTAEERRVANAPGGIGEKAFMEEKKRLRDMANGGAR